MGKWDHLRSTLSKLPYALSVEDLKYQEKVDEEKAKVKERSTDGLLKLYAKRRAEYEEAQKKADVLRVTFDAVTQTLIEVYEKKGVTSQALAGIGSIRIEIEPYAQIVDKEALRQWCLENNYGGQLSLNWQTANSIVKDLINDAKEPPSSMKVYFRPKPVFTKQKS